MSRHSSAQERYPNLFGARPAKSSANRESLLDMRLVQLSMRQMGRRALPSRAAKR